MTETREQREARFNEQREIIITELLAKYPDLQIRRKQYTVELVYYVPSYADGKIQIGERTRGINNAKCGA